MVEFPLENFDMSPNMARARSADQPDNPHQAAAQGLKALSAFSPWKHPKRFRLTGSGEDTTYELYGVCNHHGTDLQGGHYTAYCKNPTDGFWYFFDDVNTRRISESDIITKDAYILFYQKSSLCSSSSASSSSSGSNQDHWVYRMPDFYYKAKNETKCAPAPRQSKSNKTSTAKKSTTADDDKKVESESATVKDESFSRNSRKYSTMPSKRTSDLIQVDTENYSANEQAALDSDDDDGDSPSR